MRPSVESGRIPLDPGPRLPKDCQDRVLGQGTLSYHSSRVACERCATGGVLVRGSSEAKCRRTIVVAGNVTGFRKRRIKRLAGDLARESVPTTYLIVEIDELD